MMRNLGSKLILVRNYYLIEGKSRHFFQVSRLFSTKISDEEARRRFKSNIRRRKRDDTEKTVAKNLLGAFGVDVKNEVPKQPKTMNLNIKPGTVSKPPVFSSISSPPKSSNTEDLEMKKKKEVKESKSLFSDLLLSSLSKSKPDEQKSGDINRMKSLLLGLSVEKQEEEGPVKKTEIEDIIIQAAKKLMSYRAADKLHKPFEEILFQRKQTPTLNFVTGKRIGIFDQSMTSSDVQRDVFVPIQQKENTERIQQLYQMSGTSLGYEELLRNAERIWKFPVDNEVVKVDEKDVGFEEHVFLEEYLEEFPHAEPVRRFMELVITGLQQNPYITAQEKRQQIYWFKSYFEQFPTEDLEFS